MWLEDPTTKLEKAAHAAWPGVLEEAQLPIVGWSYVLLSKREDKRFGPHFIFGRAPKAWAVQISATIAAPRTGRLCRTLFAIGKSVSRLSTDRHASLL